MNHHTLKGKGCEVTIVEASQNEKTGQRLITFVCRYWRAIHSEVLTHRVFSRNASSSRAIPTAKLLEQVRINAAGPVHFGKNQSGMQASEEHDAMIAHPRTGVLLMREEAWALMAAEAADWAQAWADAGYHKQIVNRIIEPYVYITTVITATDWDNWNELRAHVDAQPEIQDLAYTMLPLLEDIPARVVYTDNLNDPRSWHLPFVTFQERATYKISELLAMSAARCARTSYLTHDKQNPQREEDERLYRRLVESKPLHASPLEHQAHASSNNRSCRNFRGGWVQHRALLEIAGSIDALRNALR